MGFLRRKNAYPSEDINIALAIFAMNVLSV
jgi:hypothetical protein